MLRMKISEMITDRYKLRIPPTVYYDLLADVREVEEEQEPRRGHWIKHDTPNSTYYDCSHCGCVAPCTEFADSYLWKLSNFCPDCGRRMEGIISYFPSTEVEE